MAVAPLTPARLTPPLVGPHTDDATARPTQAWIDYYQQAADQLANLQASQGKGVADGTDAAAGMIGEYLTATFSGVPVTSNVITNVGTLALTAGDWDVSGDVVFTSSANNLTVAQGWVSNTLATPPGNIGRGAIVLTSGQMASGTRLPTGPLRLSLAAAGTAYLGCYVLFGSGTVTAGGMIAARRMR